MPKISDDEVFDALNEWDTDMREKGATMSQIAVALAQLMDVLNDESAEDE